MGGLPYEATLSPLLARSTCRAWLHADRTVGGDRHYCHSHWPAPTGCPKNPRGGRPHELQQQPAPTRPGLPQLPRFVWHLAAERQRDQSARLAQSRPAITRNRLLWDQRSSLELDRPAVAVY